MQKFPEGFYWGASTASYQVEGWNENADWAKAAKDKKVPPAGRLADHYHRFEEDFDIAKKLGHNAHRFSVEWARIEPREGQFDQTEIEHYRQVLKALKKRNIKPFITLWHFTLPIWFSESGGFERKDAPDIFARYAAFVTRELGDLCDNYATINEENIYSTMGYLRGAWPPFWRFTLATIANNVQTEHRASEALAHRSLFTPIRWWRVVRNLKRAHRAAYDAIKVIDSSKVVGIVHQTHVYRANWNPLNMLAAWGAHMILNGIFASIFKYCDEIGVNYYHYKKFGDKNAYQKTDMGWPSNPEQIYYALRYMSRFKKPLFVSEAGVADADDDLRADYIRKQITGTQRAYNEGVDVRGHFYWSLMDNYEWDLGIGMRFGLVEIDYQTLERKIRPSAWEYKKYIDQNGV